MKRHWPTVEVSSAYVAAMYLCMYTVWIVLTVLLELVLPFSVIGEIQTELESEWAQIIVRAKKAFMQHLGKTNCCEEGEL